MQRYSRWLSKPDSYRVEAKKKPWLWVRAFLEFPSGNFRNRNRIMHSAFGMRLNSEKGRISALPTFTEHLPAGFLNSGLIASVSQACKGKNEKLLIIIYNKCATYSLPAQTIKCIKLYCPVKWLSLNYHVNALQNNILHFPYLQKANLFNYLMTPNSFPILEKAAIALSRCSCSWAALSCTLIRAAPFGTTG